MGGWKDVRNGCNHQGNTDKEAQELKEALEAYEAEHKGAEAALYRQNNAFGLIPRRITSAYGVLQMTARLRTPRIPR